MKDLTANNRLKNQSQYKENILKGQSDKIREYTKYDENFRVSFEYLDVTQGQNFKDWEENNILSKMNYTLLEYCKEPIHKKWVKILKNMENFRKKQDLNTQNM